MNMILNLSFVPFVLCLLFRLIISSMWELPYANVRTFTELEFWMYGVSLALLALSFWHHLVRRRCPECRSTYVTTFGSHEYNQVHRIKKMTERDNNGNSVTRNLNVTVGQWRHKHRCRECSKEWISESEHEK